VPHYFGDTKSENCRPVFLNVWSGLGTWKVKPAEKELGRGDLEIDAGEICIERQTNQRQDVKFCPLK